MYEALDRKHGTQESTSVASLLLQTPNQEQFCSLSMTVKLRAISRGETRQEREDRKLRKRES